MRKPTYLRLLTAIVMIGLPFALNSSVLADAGGVGQVSNFILSVIKVIAGLAGLVATGFFVFGGYMYITSSGNPEHLDKAKRTLLHAAIGLVIVIASFVIASIISQLATTAFGS